MGAFLGPLLAVGLMLRWANDFRAVFWVAVVPGLLSVALLAFGLREPAARAATHRANPIRRANLRRLTRAYWWVVAIGAVFTLARFSEAFLVLRAQRGGVPIALVPLVMVAMNVVYALSAYPFGKLSDRVSHTGLLALGLVVLIAADLVLGATDHWGAVLAGVALWGVHMGITQGLLATMVADTARRPARHRLRRLQPGQRHRHAGGQRPGRLAVGCPRRRRHLPRRRRVLRTGTGPARHRPPVAGGVALTAQAALGSR